MSIKNSQLLLNLLEELNAMGILEDIANNSEIGSEAYSFWRAANPRDGVELYDIMLETFTKTEINIIVNDLDFDL